MTGFVNLDGRWLVPGPIDGTVLRFDEPLSFWGGFDASTGGVIDRSHPQRGVSVAGAVTALPGSRGSSGTPGVLADALRRGTGPAALIVIKADINLVAGAIAADTLYGIACPILQVSEAAFDRLMTGVRVVARPDGPSISAPSAVEDPTPVETKDQHG